MILTLDHVMRKLVRRALAEPGFPWRSLDIDYEQPRVERLFTDVPLIAGPDTITRVYLHRIHPCEQPFRHTHPWPSAVHVVSGRYRMQVGVEASYPIDEVVPATFDLAEGSRYEMVEPIGWHSVQPIGGPSLSVMVSGAPWNPGTTRYGRGQCLPLRTSHRASLLAAFRRALGVQLRK